MYSVSVLSDTANALEDNKRMLLKSLSKTDTSVSLSNDDTFCGNMTVMATIDNFTFSSIHPNLIRYSHQWIDIIASIGPTLSRATSISHSKDMAISHCAYELVFKNTGILEMLPDISGKTPDEQTSFGFEVISCENDSVEHGDGSSNRIVWSV